MATLSEVRTRVRRRLEELSPAIWSDDDVDEAITSTLDVYNHLYPREASSTIAVNAGDRQAALTSATRQVVRVILSDGSVVEPRGAPAGRTLDERQAWEEFGSTLYFTRPLAAQTLTIWSLVDHLVSEVPAGDVTLLVLGGVWRSLQRRAVQDAKRGGVRSGVSIDLVVRHAQQEYLDALENRRRRARVRLVSGGSSG